MDGLSNQLSEHIDLNSVRCCGVGCVLVGYCVLVVCGCVWLCVVVCCCVLLCVVVCCCVFVCVVD